MKRFEAQALDAYIEAVLKADQAPQETLLVEPATARVVRGLGALSSSVSGSIGPRAEFAARLQAELSAQIAAGQAGASRRSRGRLMSRPGWLSSRLVAVAAILVLLALLAGVAYAVAPLILDAWQRNAMSNVERHDLAQELDLAQTIDGVTVRLERAYADANRIVIGYTFGSPNQPQGGGSPIGGRAFLSNAKGRRFPLLSELVEPDIGVQLGAQVLNFDASSLERGTKNVNLRLTVEAINLANRGNSAGLPEKTLQEPGGVPGEGAREHNLVRGPWVFDFSLAVAPARTADINQHATINEATVRLARVVVTPSEARVYLQVQVAEAAASRQWSPVSRLSVDGLVAKGGASWQTADGDYAYAFAGIPHEATGAWTLVVERLIGRSGGLDIYGPWVFTFTVP